MRLRRREDDEEPGSATQDAAAEERYVAELRRRIGSQTESAGSEEAGEAAPTLELTVDELARVVEGAAEERPERVSEWRWYVDYLRGRAAADGRIPREYRLLLRLVFGGLVAAQDPAAVPDEDSEPG
jgi:hypothetical protein